MNPISLYTKKIELKFNKKGVSIIDLEELVNEISQEYNVLDTNPSVTLHENFQYVTFKVTKKKETQSLGFSFGKKE